MSILMSIVSASVPTLRNSVRCLWNLIPLPLRTPFPLSPYTSLPTPYTPCTPGALHPTPTLRKNCAFSRVCTAATISQLMGEGKQIFQERTGAEGTMSVVSRDASLAVSAPTVTVRVCWFRAETRMCP